MSDFSVKFIGGEYALPSELKEYLKICDKFSQISQFLSNALLETMQISSIIDGKPCQVGAIENELKEKMHNEGKKIISMLYNLQCCAKDFSTALFLFIERSRKCGYNKDRK